MFFKIKPKKNKEKKNIRFINIDEKKLDYEEVKEYRKFAEEANCQVCNISLPTFKRKSKLIEQQTLFLVKLIGSHDIISDFMKYFDDNLINYQIIPRGLEIVFCEVHFSGLLKDLCVSNTSDPINTDRFINYLHRMNRNNIY